jgi:hypothetical protein
MIIFDNIAALLKMTLVFFIILLAIWRRFSLGSAFLLGAVGLGLIFGAGPLTILKSILGSMIHPKALSLALILVLSHSMEMAGQMRRLLDSFQGLIRSPRINMVVFPALIGLCCPCRGAPSSQLRWSGPWALASASPAPSSVTSTTGFGISGNTGGPYIPVSY